MKLLRDGKTGMMNRAAASTETPTVNQQLFHYIECYSAHKSET
jgi:hypothetical protein